VSRSSCTLLEEERRLAKPCPAYRPPPRYKARKGIETEESGGSVSSWVRF